MKLATNLAFQQSSHNQVQGTETSSVNAATMYVTNAGVREA